VKDKGEGALQKWDLQYKPAISLKRSSVEPKLLQSVYRDLCMVYRFVTNLVTKGELWPTFPGEKFFHNGYLAHFLLEHDKIWLCQGFGQLSLTPQILWTLFRGHAATCISPLLMHLQSGFWQLPMFADSFIVASIHYFTVLPEDQVQAFCTSALYRAVVPCNSTSFLLYCPVFFWKQNGTGIRLILTSINAACLRLIFTKFCLQH